jgi:hypothetical protein
MGNLSFDKVEQQNWNERCALVLKFIGFFLRSLQQLLFYLVTGALTIDTSVKNLIALKMFLM